MSVTYGGTWAKDSFSVPLCGSRGVQDAGAVCRMQEDRGRYGRDDLFVRLQVSR